MSEDGIIMALLVAGVIAAARLGYKLGLSVGQRNEETNRKATLEKIGIGHKKDGSLCYSFEADIDEVSLTGATPCALCGVASERHLAIARGGFTDRRLK